MIVGALIFLSVLRGWQQMGPAAVLPEKPAGVCPKPDGVGICVEECSSDADCQAEGKLCCSNGCGHVCMFPEDPSKQASHSQRPCVLMAVLGETEAADSLVKLVPEPSSSNILQATGILILEYEPGQDNSCCVAHGLLSKHASVKSVEYDGRSPDCRQVETQTLDEPVSVGSDQFVEVDKSKLVGGWSEFDIVDQDSLNLWEKVVAKFPDLASLGKPTAVKKQVVAGVNYTFQFQDGTTLRVFHQSWTDTLEVSDLSRPHGSEL